MFTLKIVDTKTQLSSFVELDNFDIISQSASTDLFNKFTEDFVCNNTKGDIGVVIVGNKDTQNVTKYLDKNQIAFIMNSRGKTIEVVKAVEHIPQKHKYSNIVLNDCVVNGY